MVERLFRGLARGDYVTIREHVPSQQQTIIELLTCYRDLHRYDWGLGPIRSIALSLRALAEGGDRDAVGVIMAFLEDAEREKLPSSDFIEIGQALVGLLERTISTIPTEQFSVAQLEVCEEPYVSEYIYYSGEEHGEERVTQWPLVNTVAKLVRDERARRRATENGPKSGETGSAASGSSISRSLVPLLPTTISFEP